MYIFLTPGPSMATIPICRTRKGKATTVSTSLITRVSTRPPKKPASSPSVLPSNQANTTEENPSEDIPPKIIRAEQVARTWRQQRHPVVRFDRIVGGDPRRQQRKADDPA